MKQGRSRPTQADGSRPPLMAPATWIFQPGATAAPFVLWVGRLALVLSVGLALMWWSAMLLDVTRGQRAALAGGLSTLMMLAWVMLWWRVWQGWHRPPAAFTLTWTQAREDDAKAFGWQTSKGEPAQVSVMLDAQRWLLCKVQIRFAKPSLPRRHGRASHGTVHWCWLDMAHLLDAHRFRTLIKLNAGLLDESDSPLIDDSITMASWRMPQAELGVAVKSAGSSFSATLPMTPDELGSSQERV